MTDVIPNGFGNLLTTSETVIGLILNNVQSPHMFNPDKLSPTYAKVLRDIQSGMTQEELVVKHGNTIIQTSKYAAKSVNGLGTELDWSQVVETSYRNEVLSTELDKAKKYLANGEMDKFGDFLRRANATYQGSQRMRSVLASEIRSDYEPFMKSGSKAWDTHIVGLPTMGTVILAAKTYTGKTTVAVAKMENFMKEYPDREILFVTLEDMAEGWLERARVLLGAKTPEFWSRIHVMEFAKHPNEIIEEAGRYPNLGMIMLDYIDYLVEGKNLEAYEEAYRTLQLGSKSLAVDSKFRSMPIIVLAQFGKTLYKGGVPTLAALPYTGDAGAYQICMLYNPSNDFYADDEENAFELPMVEGKGYLVFWKVKNGFRNHVDAYPGAIQVPWSPKYGFDLNSEGEWFSLAGNTRREVKKKRR